ncbi:MAG: hypothetical protein RLZZ511_4184 [Cyanobacteriota bacterium]
MLFRLFVFLAAFEEGGDGAEEVGDRVEGFFGGGEERCEDEEPDEGIGGVEVWGHGGSLKLDGIDGNSRCCRLHDGFTFVECG